MRILIIEDEHKIADSLKQGLEQESYAVDAAYDGTKGLDLALGERYDLIVLDRLLPGMDGMAICKSVRRENVHTPILMLTAKGQVYEKVEGLNTGADDYLVKPFSFEELLARIKALLRRPEKTIGATIKVGDLTLDTASYQVKRAGKQIELSHKEYALLEYFMRHPNKILSKEQLIENVWNYEANILPNTVEVYIGYLRNKIDKPFKKQKQLLQTVRGFGYKIG